MLCVFLLHEGDLQYQLLAGAQILLFSTGYLLINCYVLWKALNPSCISEQIRDWKHRKQENIYEICRGADMHSARKLRCWAYILAHHTVILSPFLGGSVSLLSDLTSDWTYIVFHICQKTSASRACPDGNNRMSEIQQRTESWGQALCSNYSTVLCMMRKPCRVQAWKYQRYRRWWVDGKKYKDNHWAERKYPETVALCSKASPRCWLGAWVGLGFIVYEFWLIWSQRAPCLSHIKSCGVRSSGPHLHPWSSLDPVRSRL